jgi:hypothetical protein
MTSELFARKKTDYFRHPTCYQSESMWLNYLAKSINNPSLLTTKSITITTKENKLIPAKIITKMQAEYRTSIVIASPEPKLLGALLDFPEEYTPLRPLRPHYILSPEVDHELKLINTLSQLGYDESMTFAPIFMGLLSTLNIAVDPNLPTKVAKHWERTRVI